MRKLRTLTRPVIVSILLSILCLLVLTPSVTRPVSATTSDLDWVTRGNMAAPRLSFSAASCNGMIYAIGGALGSSNFDYHENPVEEYDPTTDLWRTRARATPNQIGAGVACLNGKLYAIGGSAPFGSPIGSNNEFDPSTYTWIARASMPTAREAVNVAASNGKIYAIGGFQVVGGYPVDLTTVEEYDPDTDSWSTRASAPGATSIAGVATATNGHIYVIGATAQGGYTYDYDPVADTWQVHAGPPTPRSDLAVAASSNGKIYAIGGLAVTGTSSAVEEYDPATNTWQTKASMPTARHALASAGVGTRIFALGGTPSFQFLATVEEYDSANNVWIPHGSSMPTVRAYLGATTSSGQLYAIGGYYLDVYGTRHDLATVEAYDPVTNSWNARASMPTPREGLGVVTTSNGEIYAIGGYNSSGDLATVEEYTPTTNSWRTRSTMLTPRSGLAVTLGNDGKIYAIGGWNGSTPVATVEAYDPVTDIWQARAILSVARGDLSATALDGRIYAIGGMGSNVTGTVEEYDPATNTWRLREYMPTPREGLGVVAPGNGKIYAVGGWTVSSLGQSIYYDTVEEYDPATNTWTSKAGLPMGQAYFGITVGENGELYVMGGAYSDTDFAATMHETTVPPQTSYAVFGLIRDNNGNRLGGVQVSTNTGVRTTTDAQGYYALPGLSAGTYTITASETGYTFSPLSSTLTVSADTIQQDFTGTPLTYSISGNVSGDSNCVSSVSISDGAGHTTTTASNGNYSLSGLPAGTYTLTASRTGCAFSASFTQPVTVPPNATGANFTGTSSSINIGFRPNPNGYQFANYGGFNLPDFTIDDMRRMFSDSAVCQIVVGSTCIPKPGALIWNLRVNWEMNNGHCDGFTTTALRFFKGIDSPSSFQAGANTTYDLLLANARRNIAYYWALQVPSPVAAARSQAIQKNPNQVLAQLDSAMSGGANDPTTLVIYNGNGTSGHSILPYAIEDQGGGTYWIDVYDNNHPNDATRHVVLNTTSNTWSYNLGGSIGTWSGDSTTHSLGAIPLSTYAEQPQCPWCTGEGGSQVWLSGQGHLLITNSQGQQIGYVSNQFINEIPGAFGSVPPGGLGNPEEPIYTLPITDTYRTLLDGQTLTQAQTVTVTQFGPGYAISADGVTMQPTTQDTLIFASDGKQLGYHSSDTKPLTLTLALDGATQSNQFQIQNVNVGASHVITTSVDTSRSKLVLNDSQGSSSTYNLNVTLVGASGTQKFVHSGIQISATDTQYLDYGTWNGTGPITLEIDQGSQGRISQTVTLANQVFSIFLPFIRR